MSTSVLEDLGIEQRNSLYGFEMRAPDRRRSTKPRSFNIKQLWQRSHEILNLALLGHSQKTIAKLLGVTEVTVSNTLNSEIGQKKLSKLRIARDEDNLKISEEIADLTKRAIETYKELFDAPVENTGYKLKKELADTVMLDMAGHRAPTKIDTRSMNLHLTPTEIEEFKLRGLEMVRRKSESEVNDV